MRSFCTLRRLNSRREERSCSYVASGARARRCPSLPAVARRAAPLTWAGSPRTAEPAPLGLGDARPVLGWKLPATAWPAHPPDQWSARAPRRCGTERTGSTSRPCSRPGQPGPALEPGTQNTWRVRAWDETNTAARPAAPAQSPTGRRSDRLAAKWIAAPADRPEPLGARWIWFKATMRAKNIPALTRYLRATFTLATTAAKRAPLFTVVDEATSTSTAPRSTTPRPSATPTNAWQKAQRLDVAALKAGTNTIAVQVKNRLNRPAARRPGGFIAACRPADTTFDDQQRWKSSTTGPPAGSSPASTTPPGRRRASSRPTAPARGARTSSSRAAQPLPAQGLHGRASRSRRRACTSPRSASTSPLNGRRSATDVLAPGWTEYTKRIQYQTYDVTDLSPGRQRDRRVLGDGWYAGRLQGGAQVRHDPGLLAQLKLTYTDGTTTP